MPWESHLRARTLGFGWHHLYHIYSDFIISLSAKRTQWVQVNQRCISSPLSSSNLCLRIAKGVGELTTTTRSWSLHPCLLYCLKVIWGDPLKMSKMNRLEWVFHSFRDETDSPGGRRSLKCSGLTMLLLTLRAMVLILILGCKTARWGTLARKSLFSDSASTAEAPRAETSLLPVWAISGLGAFTSSSRSSDWSRLIWRIEFLTTKDALCQAGKCLSPLFTKESENFVRKVSQQHSSISAHAGTSCCPWSFSWTRDFFSLPALSHYLMLITHQLWPSCYIPHQRWQHAPGLWADFPAASYHGALSLLCLHFASSSINVKYY